jgi:hypothetical protein
MIDENGDCNSYSAHFKLQNLLNMFQEGIELPEIVRMPRSHYTLVDNELYGIDLDLVISPRNMVHGNRSRGGYISCADSYIRVNGTLQNARYIGGYKSMMEKQEHYGDRYYENIAVTCKLTLRDHVDSIVLHMATGYKLGGVFMWGLTLNIEVRRTGIRPPLLSVVGGDIRHTVERNRAAIIPVSGDEGKFFCMSEATSAPVVTATKGGYLEHENTAIMNRERTSMEFQFGTFLKYVFHGYGGYIVESPKEMLGEENYTCRAEVGDDVISKKITLVRFEEVKLKETRISHIGRHRNTNVSYIWRGDAKTDKHQIKNRGVSKTDECQIKNSEKRQIRNR